MELKILRSEAAKQFEMPVYATEGSSGFDLQAAELTVIPPGSWVMIATGIRVALPPGHELQIRSRSGMSSKGLTVLNSPGTIDADYRGEIKILLRNHSHRTQQIDKGMKIAQAILAPVLRATLREVTREEDLGFTSRGTGGFGSTDT